MKLQEKLLKLMDTRLRYRLVVVCAEDESVLSSVKMACDHGIIEPIFIGDRTQILQKAAEVGLDVSSYQIMDEANPTEACRLGVHLSFQPHHLLMKGLVDTKIILREVLKYANRQSEDIFLSHISLAYVESYQDKFYIISDGGLNIAPTIEQKGRIIDNAIDLAQALSIDPIHVAVLSAVEKVNEKIPSSIDAQAIMHQAQSGRFPDAIVEGPYGLDNAINLESAHHKSVQYQGAGQADVLIVPNIESGNMLIKSMTYFAKAETAGIVLGSKIPILVNSRSDSASDKFNSILLGCVVVQHG